MATARGHEAEEKSKKGMFYMMFNTYVDGDPREFMYYKGEWYINGTEIALTETYMKYITFYDKKLWKYARFHHVTYYNNQTAYFFSICKNTCGDLYMMGYKDPKERRECQINHAPYFVITASELEYAIEEITKPIKLSQKETEAIQKGIEDMIENPKTDWDYPEMRIAWLVYIVAMVGSLIFTEFYIPWIIATYVFFTYRKGIIQ